MAATAPTAKRAAPAAPASISDRVAEHVLALRYEDLPASTIAAAKRLMLDTLAVAWGGSDAPGSEPVRALMAAQGGRAESTVWAYGGRMPAADAAFLNSMFGAALDYDGVNTVHADVVALPAALGVAERQRASGKEFLTAFVIGSDLCCRLGGAISGPHRGWFITSIYGVFGAAATAARLLGLDAAAVRHAFGIALSQSAGTQQANIEQALTKRLQSAFAARAGVFSAFLASAGVTAPREAFEGKFGLYQLYQSGDPQKILQDLGQRFAVETTSLKKYPCCACSHAALEASLALVEEHDLKPEDVTSVEVIHSPMMHRLVGAPFNPGDNPQVTAQFSLQYAVASALLRRRLGIGDIQDAAVLDPAIRPLTERVKIVVDENSTATRAPATVNIATRHRGVLSRTTGKFPWSPEDPPDEAALRAKFRQCFSSGAAPLDDTGTGKLIERIEGIEQVDDMSRFFEGIIRT
jgi:2-methylcitrate dehydratase PrpD